MNTNECTINDTEILDELKALNKTELINLVMYADTLAITKGKLPKGPGRKEQILAFLQAEPRSIPEIAEKFDIETRNVSSQLSYLRADGYKIATNSKGQKFLEL